MFSIIKSPLSLVTLPLTILLSAAFNSATGQKETDSLFESIILPSNLF